MLFGVISYLKTLRRFYQSRVSPSPSLLSEISLLAGQVGLRSAPRLWLASAVPGPAVTGLLRPTLLLPDDFEARLAPHEARFVLRHELMHLKRGDVPVSILLGLVLAIHWFNPLLWLAFFKSRLDRETACDAQVLSHEDQTQRVAYGYTLLKVESAFQPRELGLGFAGLFQRGNALRSRVRSIACPAHTSLRIKVCVTLGMACMTFLGITKAVPPESQTEQILIHVRFIEIPMEGAQTLPVPINDPTKAPGYLGTLPDRQFQKVIATLSQLKGADLLSAPSLTTRSGQRATVEVVRAMKYKDESGHPLAKDCGVMCGIMPRGKINEPIDLDLSPQIVEFNGFAEHPSGWKEPIFLERALQWHARVTPGETTVLELESKTDHQIVQDEDGAGHVFHTETVTYKRRLLVFVTAEWVDPAREKIRPSQGAQGNDHR